MKINTRTPESLECCDDLNNQGGEFRYIPLTRGQITKVDKEDYEWLSKYRWYAKPDGNSYYADRSTTVNGRDTHLAMHREVFKRHRGEIPTGYVLDHIDQNKLNNSLSNLRLVTPRQNIINTPKVLGKSSKYLGVHFNKQANKWKGQITIKGKQFYLGYFDSEIEAAKARDLKAKQTGLYLDHNLNFPQTEKPLNYPIADLYHL